MNKQETDETKEKHLEINLLRSILRAIQKKFVTPACKITSEQVIKIIMNTDSTKFQNCKNEITYI